MFFPHNLDFRGRAYPIPPNLNHMGNDFTRGVLRFAEAKRLGPRGLYWLKVQHKLSASSSSSDCRSNSDSTAALHGADKLSFDEREAYCTEHMEQVRDSAEHPLDGKRWWAQSDDPWQCLAACMEVTAAIDSHVPQRNSVAACAAVFSNAASSAVRAYTSSITATAIAGLAVSIISSSATTYGCVATCCDTAASATDTMTTASVLLILLQHAL
eukprot:1938-Heterococcus_DN1.PRE.1